MGRGMDDEMVRRARKATFIALVTSAMGVLVGFAGSALESMLVARTGLVMTIAGVVTAFVIFAFVGLSEVPRNVKAGLRLVLARGSRFKAGIARRLRGKS